MNNWWTVICAILLGGSFFLVSPRLHAATDDDVIAALQAQVAELSARLEAIESRSRIREDTYQMPTTGAAARPEPSWSDRIRLKGDFRYRHESIDAEFADNDRHRNRIRARPAIVADVTDTVEVGFGIATGSDDPVSTNQTLGDSFSSKPVNLDLAYFDWSTPLDGLNVLGGKYKNPLHRTGGNGLIWDSDLRPEGLVANYRRGGLNVIGLVNWVTESSSKDNLAFGGQVGWSTPIGEASKVLIGAGYYDLGSIQGRPVPFDGDPRGNSVDLANNYLYGYEELELFGEFSFRVGDRPTTLFANYVENLDAPELDQGWAIGGAMQFQHGNHPWQLAYAYQDLEADAVFAMFTDSDFIGGGTDGKGHIFRGSYTLTKNVSLGGTLFINERGEDQTGIAEDYNRLMLDVEFKY
jgi:hypothetical protein